MSGRTRLVVILAGFWCSGFGVGINLASLVKGMPGGAGRAFVTLFLIVSAVCAMLIGNSLYRELSRAVEDETETPEIV